MYTEYKQSRLRAGGYEDRETEVKQQEEALEDYINKGQFAFSVHMETSPNFRKILMNVASERGHVHVVRYCVLKAKQDRAQKNCDHDAEYTSKYQHHPTEQQLLRQERTKQVLIHTEHQLHTLRAKMLAFLRPDDPGMRVLYERALAGLTLHERTVKEIQKFSHPFAYDGMDGHHTESIKRMDTLVMLRCEHYDKFIAQYKGRRASGDAGALAVVSWLARRKHKTFFGTRPWRLKMNDATGRAAAVTSTIEKYAIHLADEPDGKPRVGYNQDFSGQPKSFREEMMESYDLMVRAIDKGWITGWSFGLAEKWGDSTEPRIVSETSLTNGRKMAISLPAPLYWRIFFRIEPPRKNIDVVKDAWLGAGILYELARYHIALIQGGVHKRSNQDAWLEVLAYADVAPTEEAVPKGPIATATSDAHKVDHLDSLRILPGWHVTESMMNAIGPARKHLNGPHFSFTLAQSWQQGNGRNLVKELDRTALRIVPSHSWGLMNEIERIREAQVSNAIEEYHGKATVFSSLPDTLVIDVGPWTGRNAYTFGSGPDFSATLTLPEEIDFRKHGRLVKNGVEAIRYELVGLLVVKRTKGDSGISGGRPG